MSKSKAKGTRAETKVVRYLTGHGVPARRLALTGSKDQGDIALALASGEARLEVKAGEQTRCPSRSQMVEWLRQAKEESINSGYVCYLCVVRYRRSIEDAEVWDLGKHMRWLSDFAWEEAKAIDARAKD